MVHLPRWVTLTLWSVAALAAGSFASWWWVTWPARTAHRFAVLMEQGRFDEANRLMRPPAKWVFEDVDGRSDLRLEGSLLPRNVGSNVPAILWQSWCSPDNLDIPSRSIREVLVGQQSFHFTRQYTPPFFVGGVAERGAVHFRCEPWATGVASGM